MSNCEHDSNCMIKMPGIHGGAVPDACPFVWCRQCGALWIPKLPSFDRAFEHHAKERCTAPIDGMTIEGYWILPGKLSLFMPS